MTGSALPARVVSGRLFLGQAAVSREKNLEALATFSTPEAVRDRLEQARTHEGVGGIMTLGDERIVKAVALLRKGGGPDFAVLPVIPNVPGYVREATEYGLAGAGVRRLLRVGPLGFLGAAATGAVQAPRVLKKDFPTLLSILYALEMGEFRKFDPPAVFLHHQMTDLALSFGNRRVFEGFIQAMRKRYDAEPGFATSNLPALARRFRAWGLEARLVAAPVNRAGFLMPGGAEAFEAAVAHADLRVVAERVAPEAPEPPEDVRWVAERAGVTCVALEAPQAA